jgi:hypothetical protein
MKTIRVRPVLVETSEKSRICHLSPKGIQYKDLRFLEIECPIILDSINYDIVLISLDDCAKVGDMYYDEQNNLVLKATEYTEHNVYLYKKVIANQRQFSDELSENLVEEYNNGGMNDFEIYMTTDNAWTEIIGTIILPDTEDVRSCHNILDHFNIDTDFVYEQLSTYNGDIPYPMLANGCIIPVDYVYKQDKSIVKPLNDYINQKHNQDRCIGFIDGYETRQFENKENKEGIILRNIPYPIIYTEDDVRILFKNWIKLKSDEVGLDNLSFDEWFETVKK